jgi:predicted nuclease of predicted toxin-antitoxin system
MKILIDECLPRKLKFELPDHDVQTVPEAGWAGKKNGELLKLMADVFDVFITIDNNLSDQQQLEQQPTSFIVLRAHNNKFSTLQPLMVKVREILPDIQVGRVIRISSEDID